jgi:hypothetical protein
LGLGKIAPRTSEREKKEHAVKSQPNRSPKKKKFPAKSMGNGDRVRVPMGRAVLLVPPDD